MKKKILISLLSGTGLTVLFYFLSLRSMMFNSLTVVSGIRYCVFAIATMIGMNPHQPSDGYAIPVTVLLFGVIIYLIWLVADFFTRKRLSKE